MQLFHLVEVGVDAVSHKVAEVGLGRADAALAGGGVRDVEITVAHSDLLAQHIVHGVHPASLHGSDACIHAFVGGDEFGGDGAVRSDGHLANVGKVRTGLGQGDSLAGSILHLLVLHYGMGVAVDKGVKAAGVGNDFLTGPRRGRGVYAQMTQTDDHVCQKLCLINGLLHGIVELFAVLAALNIVDVLALCLIHKVGRGGLGKGLGGGHTHKGDASAAAHKHLDGGQHPQRSAQVYPVAGQVREVGFLHDGLGTVHAVVKLVVAGGGDIVTGSVHQLDDGSTLVHGAVGGALHMVACIHQQHILAGILIALLQVGNSGVGQLGALLVDVGMDIVCVQDGNVRLVTIPAGRCGRLTDGHGCSGSGHTSSL